MAGTKMNCPDIKDVGRIVEKLPLKAFDAGHTLTRMEAEEETNGVPKRLLHFSNGSPP